MRRVPLISGLLAGALLLAGPTPAFADPAEVTEASRASSLMTDSGLAAPADALDERIWLTDEKRPVAPGIELRSFQWLDAGGFMRGDVLRVDLGSGQVNVDHLFPGKVAAAEPIRATAERAGAVAAVNGDFFDINNSNSPQGVELIGGKPVKGPNPNWNKVVGVDEPGLGRMTSMFLEASLLTPAGVTRVDGLNQAEIGPNGIGAFTPLWGDYTRARVTNGATRVREVIVTDGVVTATATEAGAGQLPDNQIAIVGRNAGADALATLTVGDKVTLDYRLRNDGAPLKAAIGGNVHLVRGGAVVPQTDKAVHPRTAAGFSADGRTMFLVTIDGRMADSRGMSYEELGRLLVELGAHEALNLDGGGSSTLVAREAGETSLDVENEPSDGTERHVPNGLGLFAQPGSGKLTGMRVAPALDDDADDLLKVFPRLTRTLEALGHDETYAPVAVTPEYRATAGAGRIDRDGVLTAQAPGEVTVQAIARPRSTGPRAGGPLRGQLTVTVLGDLARLRSTADKVTILDPADPVTFSVIGADRNGFEAPIEPRDVRLAYDKALVAIAPDGRGGFTVKALKDAGTTVLTATVDGVTLHIPVAVGAQSTVVADFADAASWRFTHARGAGSVAPTTGHDGGPALKMDFDFTLSTATRVGYARPPQPLVLQGQPLAIGAWVHGDGQGEWTSFGIQDGTGKAMSLYGPYITWTGWRYVEVQVPQTLQTPIQLNFVAAIETKAASSYQGTVSFDDVTVKTSPAVEVPAVAPVQDPVVNQHTALDTSGRTWTFAVISDAQFTAANQSLVPAARRTMREAVAAKPDFVVITGDLVDTGYPADMALARQIIDEELTGKVPWHYVPGNHEIYGTNSPVNFEATFGPAQRTFDHQGTRFVLLDSSTSTLLGGGFDQWQMLRRALDGAASDPAINGVVTMFHHPPRDPSPLKNSQLTNRVEAATVEQWLADFRLNTGKGAAFIGSHVGAFSANSVDAVPYVVNGNMGKTPATSIVAQGGFTGWTLVGIDPTVKPTPGAELHRVDPSKPGYKRWMQVEMRAHVDDLALTAPTTLGVGASASATGHVTQHGRTFELEYPVSAAWGGTGVFVGRPDAAPAGAVVAYDPAARTVTGLRAGTAELTLTVNGVTRTQPITVG